MMEDPVDGEFTLSLHLKRQRNGIVLGTHLAKEYINISFKELWPVMLEQNKKIINIFLINKRLCQGYCTAVLHHSS